MFSTALCDLLGIEYPILQSGMGSVAGPDLVAEVCRAGGLGILAGLNVPPEGLRNRIHEVRRLTDRPFGVNLWLHEAIASPLDPRAIADATVAGAQRQLNEFRDRLGIPRTETRPGPAPDLLAADIDVVLDERVPVFSTALIAEHSPDLVRRCHARGVKVVSMVATVDDARAEADAGVDAIVAQGGEAGGHRSVGGKPASPEAASVGTMALVPQIVDAVRVPVVAAGGIADGRGLVAALALGASGVLLGTRFVATREATVPEFWKKRLLEEEASATALTDVFTGLWARGLRNRFVDDYRASGAPVLPPLVQRAAANDIYAAAATQQNDDYFPMWSGQGVGLIRDLPGAADVVEAIVREARAILRDLPSRIRLG